MRAILLSLLFAILITTCSYGERIKLPQSKYSGSVSLEEAIYKRRSEPSLSKSQISMGNISELLWACQGITDIQWFFRSAPSAGAIYPLTIYLIDDTGSYRYLPETNELELVVKGDKRTSLARAALSQTVLEDAPITILIAASLKKSRAKFGLRGDRYVYLEAGHAAQNLLLEASALGLGAIPIGSFWDDVISSVLSLPPDQEPLYLIPIGYAKKT